MPGESDQAADACQLAQGSFSVVEGKLWKGVASSLPSQAVLDHHSSARASAFSIASGDSYSVRAPYLQAVYPWSCETACS